MAPELNVTKRHALLALRAEWKRTVCKAWGWYWAPFWQSGQFDPHMAVSGLGSRFPATQLVTSQKDLMLVALAAQAKGWTGNVVNRARPSVANASVNDSFRHELFWINAMRLWHVSNARQNELLADQNKAADLNAQKATTKKRKLAKPEERLTAISQAATRMMRKWFAKHLQRVKLPNPENLPLAFNINSATLVKARESKYQYFNWWARISTLERGQRVEIPLQGSQYFDTRQGEMNTTLELHERGGELYLKVCFTREPEKWSAFKTDVLALDLGLRNFLASSEGDLRGENFLNKLRQFDKQIQFVQKGLQQARVEKFGECRRYSSLIARVRGYLKTNIRKWLRSILAARQPRRVVIERLAFTGQDMSLGRTLNRLIRGFGQALFKEALAQWSVEFGFEVEEVNPAYTSQTCTHCGFVHRRNRIGNRFACLSCGFKAHADVNAAKCQRGRSAPEPESAVLPAGRHEWWSRTLKGWILRLRESLLKAAPGSTLELCLVGRACAGVSLLLKQKGPKALSKKMKRWLERALQQPDIRHLRNVVVRCIPRMYRLETLNVSTR
ncbi:transposase [Paraburkholderia sp. UCT31]|uniref:transposase n=1 Tax=Paraburkholderia sp. UCT31 TaxID=2615209 RepID=UPI00292A5494|nr:transposase [Paraburkholderia sp. UCT31]